MDKTGKNFKIWGTRFSILGDTIMSLVILNALEKRFPGSYKYFHIAKRCAHAAPLYFNHPLIDRIVISDYDEEMGTNDAAIAKTCDIILNTKPPFHSRQDWPNSNCIYRETFFMSGLPLEWYDTLSDEEKRPKLAKWFNVERQPAKTIALWPCAGYGNENKRNPSREWYVKLINKLHEEGYNTIQFGHPKDYNLFNAINGQSDAPSNIYTFSDTIQKFQTDSWGETFKILNHLPFFDQIKMTLGCDLVISTDSGSGLIFGAYEMPQISLLTNHFPNHTKNLTAFAPNNPNNTNFIGIGSPDNIEIFKVLQKVKELCP